ncbi:ribonuclease H-like domain-containing protein [Natranaeroarchaeum sulfidigenes]|uniref:Uncharacterized protein n=1 Tax=Natranaeroarchaeum sulfidigenes TaxID=2784880 RepID=A0A897MU12_9EURY|nr:ribonuclease H-like domain-containing protein [Natranaeroarchaeum sulfidigenes]QSG01686.1 Uncharacterized protein AArcS_0457 [Natranaeroarchaeum sulfidigenes]
MSSLSTVAFDIETTGFTVGDRLTVVGFDAEIGSHVFLNTDGKAPTEGLEERINDAVTTPVALSIHNSEDALLYAVTEFVESTLSDQDIKLVAYNGETWNGGFDLPFLRTRLNHHDLGWPFEDIPYIEAMDVFQSRFNTTENSLVAVYEELIGGDVGDVDPFVDSASAVDAWERGEFEDVVLHNVADIRRTRALMDLAERYCSKSDFSMKSLDPVVSDRH